LRRIRARPESANWCKDGLVQPGHYRDRFSGVHLITAGGAAEDPSAIIDSQRLSITLEALARSYNHVVVDAGALPEIAAERFARLAPRAVLIADHVDSPDALLARQRLEAAGFAKISVLSVAAEGETSEASGRRAAA